MSQIERAAEIVQWVRSANGEAAAFGAKMAFLMFFNEADPGFDAQRFEQFCDENKVITDQ